ncbi:MAG: HEAT repeat domain-containing protein [Planctomycetota bacterium]|nr:HEAT repeat domain-containing protein [Planctomycetota bacterium]
MKRGLLLLTVLFAARACAEAAPQADAERKAAYARYILGLRDMNAEKVRAAADGLADLKLPQAAPYLWQLYEGGEGQRRRIALNALGRLKPEGYEDRLFEASLADPLHSMRKLAAETLVRILGADAVAARLLQALDDPKRLNAVGRLRAVQVLGHVGGQGAGEALAKLLADKDADVAAAAAEGLGDLGDLANAPALIANLNHANPEVRPSVVDGLELLTGQKNGFDRVKWERWSEDYKAGKFKEAPPDDDVVISFTDPAYRAKKEKSRNPFERPIKECGIDVAVIFDTTGSMAHIWPEMSNALDGVLREIEKNTPSPRMGAVRYRAADPRKTVTYLIQPRGLSRDTQAARDFMLDASFGGGSGGLHLGIRHAISSFAWRANARRMVLLVGDTTPAGDALNNCLAMIKEAWEQDGIMFNTLYVRTLHGEEHKNTYNELAAAGCGRFYEYDKAWKHLVDQTVPNPDPKKAELSSVTWEKWLTPLPRKK